MAGFYHERQECVHIFSHMPGDVDVYAWEDAEHDAIFVAIEFETPAHGFGPIERSSVVISLRASDYPAFAQRVCDALAAVMTGEDMQEAAFS